MRDAAIHRVSQDADGGCGTVIESQWIATGLRPRDDKAFCHCEERTQVRDAAIHRVLRDADGGCGSFIESQWIATGFALGMTRWGKTAF